MFKIKGIKLIIYFRRSRDGGRVSRHRHPEPSLPDAAGSIDSRRRARQLDPGRVSRDGQRHRRWNRGRMGRPGH